MGSDSQDTADTAVFDNLRGIRDELSGQRVFGEAYIVDDLTVIPVARVSGGGGGGGGEGTGPDDDGGRGFGAGFRLAASPVGVYEIRDGNARWNPAIDVNRLAKGGQVLAGIVAVCITLVVLRRR